MAFMQYLQLESEVTGLFEKTYSRLIQSTTRPALNVTQSSHFISEQYDSVHGANSFSLNTGKTKEKHLLAIC